MANNKQEAETDFQALRNILFGPEKKQVEELTQRFDNPQKHAEAVSQVLPKAIQLSAEQEDNQLNAKLMPVVEEVVKVSVRKDIHVFADALFPVIGPAIRKSISETFRQMLQSINQALEHSFSWKGIKWRFEAWHTGKSFAEIVLLHSLVYRVEQVFLIHKDSGILIQHVALAAVEHQDADLVSAMLTAIQDFVKDSFDVKSEENLNQVRMGDLSLWIEQGPDAVIAGVIRGDAPENTRETLLQTLENIHQQFQQPLKSFAGDVTTFHPCEEMLQTCLLSQYQSEKKNVSWLTWLILASLGAMMFVWIFVSVQQLQDWNNYVRQLKNEPGYIITDATKEQGKYIIRGLRDPLAKQTEQILATSQLSKEQVEHQFQAYHSLQADFVLKRAKQFLTPSQNVNISYKNGILSVVGKANRDWINTLTERSRFIAGVTALNLEQLQPQLDLSRFDAPDSVQLTISGEKLIARGDAPYVWNERVKKMLSQDPDIRQYDDSQLHLHIDLSSLQLPMGVTAVFKQNDLKQGELVISGNAPNRWIESLSRRIASLPAVKKVNLKHLANADLNLLMQMKQELEAEAIFFESGYSIIKSEDSELQRVLDKFKVLLQQAELLSQSVLLLIQGNSDSTGVYQRRLAISLQRAERVRQFFIAQGISPQQIKIQSLVDKFEPKIETTESEKQRNRRVSFVIRLIPKSITTETEIEK